MNHRFSDFLTLAAARLLVLAVRLARSAMELVNELSSPIISSFTENDWFGWEMTADHTGAPIAFIKGDALLSIDVDATRAVGHNVWTLSIGHYERRNVTAIPATAAEAVALMIMIDELREQMNSHEFMQKVLHSRND